MEYKKYDGRFHSDTLNTVVGRVNDGTFVAVEYFMVTFAGAVPCPPLL